MKYIERIGRLILTLFLVWAGFMLVGLGFLITICTGGGGLVIVIPLAIIIIPPYFRLIWQILGGKSKELKENDALSKNQIAIRNYVAQSKASGAKNADIKNQLLNSGWSANEINKAF